MTSPKDTTKHTYNLTSLDEEYQNKVEETEKKISKLQ